jgi:hypothetical protein
MNMKNFSTAITKEWYDKNAEVEFMDDPFKGNVVVVWVRNRKYVTHFTQRSEFTLAKHHVWRTMERSRI